MTIAVDCGTHSVLGSFYTVLCLLLGIVHAAGKSKSILVVYLLKVDRRGYWFLPIPTLTRFGSEKKLIRGHPNG